MHSDFIELEQIVERVFDVDIKSRKRKREIVYARMVFSKILRERGHTTVAVAKYLNKDHTTIVHYGEKSNILLPQLPVYKSQYIKCYTEFMVDKEQAVFSLAEKKLYLSNLSLKNELESLNLENIKLHDEMEKYKRLQNIIELIDRRIPKGKEYFMLKKINQMFNSITDYEQQLE